MKNKNVVFFFSDADLGDEGPPLAVVSADVTLNSLRVFVEESLPRCRDTSVQCLIVDDSGNLIYERDLESFSDGEAKFFGGGEERLRILAANLTALDTKRQCRDLFNVQVKLRRFHNVRNGLSLDFEVEVGGQSCLFVWGVYRMVFLDCPL